MVTKPGDYPQVQAAVGLPPAPAVQLRANGDLWVITDNKTDCI